MWARKENIFLLIASYTMIFFCFLKIYFLTLWLPQVTDDPNTLKGFRNLTKISFVLQFYFLDIPITKEKFSLKYCLILVNVGDHVIF